MGVGTAVVVGSGDGVEDGLGVGGELGVADGEALEEAAGEGEVLNKEALEGEGATIMGIFGGLPVEGGGSWFILDKAKITISKIKKSKNKKTLAAMTLSSRIDCFNFSQILFLSCQSLTSRGF